MTPISRAQPGRIVAIDLARTLALIAMAVFHFSFDLMVFGHLPPGTVFSGFWPYFARSIAGSFLFLAGLSLWLAQGHCQASQGQSAPAQRRRLFAFARRLALVGGAAALVSLATYLAMGQEYIRWGILHMIALGSVLGLLFLRLPWAVVVLAAVFCLGAPFYLRDAMFDAPIWLWLGLSTEIPPMMDYEPILPWLGPMLLGIAAGKIMSRLNLWQPLRWPEGPLLHALAWPGCHSLAIYLIHQPVLFGAVWAYTSLKG